MKKIYLLFTIFLFGVNYSILAENFKLEEEKKELKIGVTEEIINEDIDEDYFFGTPEYFSFYFDYGFDGLLVRDKKKLPHAFWGSRFLDITLSYNLSPRNSNIAIVAGIGYSNSTLAFDSNSKKEIYTLLIDSKDDHTNIVMADSYLPTKKVGNYKVYGSYLTLHNAFFSLEFKYFTNKFFPKDDFVFALGGKAYIFWKANTEIEYAQNHSKKSYVINDEFNFKRLRFGFHARASWRRVGFIYEVVLGDLFNNKDGKMQGPKIGYMQKVGLFIDLL